MFHVSQAPAASLVQTESGTDFFCGTYIAKIRDLHARMQERGAFYVFKNCEPIILYIELTTTKICI